ncbi:hypothetical protein [Acaryochloris sp. IP29b_bin.137]|uniref:hypothetical protein n=1 Tax=Acaryochloris sp. IP29b_bin.137 TaxID=2969217 RepID=UPI00262826D8|nr:hypothetical protein [Acaryochloris sp. IP29b_bin.137]
MANPYPIPPELMGGKAVAIATIDPTLKENRHGSDIMECLQNRSIHLVRQPFTSL